ncbi:hypothetical protein ACQKMV_19495 [Lysinibacillus sp. NPDC094403]|uniref:hypothetical protein n=1 Tax=Lysinibacillus sp. NPDC094403 TaxID=3390581 RepID=UPI003D05F434
MKNNPSCPIIIRTGNFGILIIAMILFWFSLSTHINDEELLIFHGEWRLLRDELALKAPQERSDEEIEAKPAESASSE